MKPKLILCLALVLGGGLFGCSTNAPNQPDGLPLRYHNAQYDFTFCLSDSWKGYSVIFQQWEGQTYLPTKDTLVTTEHGPIIVLRHPEWKASDPCQDIPIMIFTRSQWEADKRGRFSIGAGGYDEEIAHSAKYVFAISSRFNADDSVRGWKEINDIVERNRTIHAPRLYPE